MTSAFTSFTNLLDSYPGQPTASLEGTPPEPDGDIARAKNAARLHALRRWEWERGQVDYRFETLEGGREGVESLRLALREARAEHHAAFRALAESVAVLYYTPLTPHLEVFMLKSNEGNIFGVWLRTPESLDLWQDVFDDNSNLVGHVGRTELTLNHANGDEQPLSFQLFHDADSHQLLLLPEMGNQWAAGTYRLTFTYHRNHGDESGSDDHRYDRPVEKRQNSDVSEAVGLEWEV